MTRTNNLPTRDFAEVPVALHYGGVRGSFDQAGWDVRTPDGERIQVEGTRYLGTTQPGASLTPIRGSAYDTVVVVVLDESFRVIEGVKNTSRGR